MARNLMALIEAAGYQPFLASDLRIYDKQGNSRVQDDLNLAAGAETRRLIRDLPDDIGLWVTYHNYYKSPDLIGPAVSKARGLTYVQFESTRASSRLNGPWSGFARAAHQASDAAQVIFYQTANDLITLDRDRFENQTLVHLRPFLTRSDLPAATSGLGSMLTAGMMRQGDKLASYRLIADMLHLLDGDWALEIAGDGPARPQVMDMMAPFGNRVRFLGQLAPEDLAAAYERAGMFVWPGV
ncbi:MAG: glycosyltransferase family 1 protein, partial [Pseudomonadota bacterium]